jgi:O-antigen/teichoic acid export membrane protein
MSTIRKQSIISSLVIYVGFLIGFINTYFFTKKGLFDESQYGLTTVFVAMSTMMMSFAIFGMQAYIAKFHPHYQDHLPPRKNDMLSWALLVSTIGSGLVIVAGIVLKKIIIRKFTENSELLVQYYQWIFGMGFGFTIYCVLEAYAWTYKKSVLTNFLKEVQWRIFTSALIVFFAVTRDFDLFIKLFSFTYPAIALVLLLYLVFTKRINFTFSVSKVTRRYFKSILSLVIYVYGGLIIMTLSQVFDILVISSLSGLGNAGIFALAKLMGSVIQAPQRGLISTTIPHISRAWKEKNMVLLQRIYQRSSINMLIFAAGIFVLIALNYKEAILTFKLQDTYLLGFNAFVFIGLTCLVDMGTGLNSQIIQTSNYWRFELISGVVLLILMLPLTYLLTKQFGILGPAIANLISVSIYNSIRLWFLWRKFRLFPFTIQSAHALMLATGCYVTCYYLFRNIHDVPGLVIRSLAFIGLYASLTLSLRLSPDFKPVLQTIRKRLSGKKD